MKCLKPLFIFLISLVIALSAFSGHLETAGREQVEKLTVAIHTDENTLTPYTYMRGYPGIEIVRWIFDSLFALDLLNQPIPWMVAEYSIDPNYKEYSLRLENNLKWHDGKPVTAEDVEFSFLYALDQDQSRWKRISNQIEAIEVYDDYSLKIILKEANPGFLAEGLADFPIIPKHIYDGKKAEEVTETIGSGPYRLVEYKQGQYYRLEAVDDYFKGTPRVKNIVMPIMVDTGAIFQALKAGQIDATTAQLAPELVETFAGDPEIQILAGVGLVSTLLQFNHEIYPFNIKEFRQAVAYALDAQDMVESVLLGYGDVGSLGFYHPELPWSLPGLTQKRDLERSNALLDGLGFQERNAQGVRLDQAGNPLKFELLVYATNPLRIRTAEIISQQLKEVGIQIEVKSLEPGTVDDLVWPGFDVSQGRNYQLTMWGWSAPVQMRPESLVELLASSHEVGTLNIGAFKSPEFDRLAEELKGELDADLRRSITEKMQLITAEEVPFVTLYYPQIIAAFRKNAYDGWVMQHGVGIMNKFSLLPVITEGEEKCDQAASGAENLAEKVEEKGAGYGWIWIIIVAAAVIGVIISIKRRKNA